MLVWFLPRVLALPITFTLMNNQDKVLLSHGSGGRLSHSLIKDVFLKYFTEPQLLNNEDASTIPDLPAGKLCFSTDSYVVKPIFFPGGNIGKLAVCGTVNDLSMRGALPLYLSAGFIIEEGFLIKDLEMIAQTMFQYSQKSSVKIITGDTKVVERGAADKIFINTSGVGIIPEGRSVSTTNAKIGDYILINGTIGDHGIAILSQREGMNFSSTIQSDCAPLNMIVESLFNICSSIHVLKDPTRGGLGTSLNEVALASKIGIEINEDSIPISRTVATACEMLGLDPLYLANEGKFITFVPPEEADKILIEMKKNQLGIEASIIGIVTDSHPGLVLMKTIYGAKRVINMPSGELLPRIC
ncbi:MAG: Hydrogenase expression/formation protein HypE [candidate division WS2 bacterium]|uniref:Hydrogenase expression/formation protein HypE n=1 Tax=Psychracetigena formicireducens TaxID=2986056 RepID=A0A9E2BIM2_PSYF1|nr:Hydrogenase expression/formation protein HypE [Candidatus Psychracetigena formicireducens]MBT9144820.1 Hydrogenase expression/formation protein HypE [Candidatus Psychracetigena formicireducens]MBT9150229.1 Hydrogenase expression/formation protein HypE [Candidatus Psychracetigena formicireducens]